MPSNKVKSSDKDLQRTIITILKKSPHYLPDLYRDLNIKKQKEHKIVNRIIKKLHRDKTIIQNKRGLFSIITSTKRIKGTITITPQGYGFVTPIDDETENSVDIFIPAKHTHSALDGDVVNIRTLEEPNYKQSSDKGPVGIVCEVVERNRPFIVGELILNEHGFAVRPLSRRLPDDIKVTGSCNNAKCGDWVRAEIVYDGKGDKNSNCKILKAFGKVGNMESDIEAVVLEYNLLPPYTEQQEQKALELTPSIMKREDHTSLYCITIDPTDAKDFDDSISVSPGNKKNDIIVGIHIADVAAWVQPNTWIDKEAAARGFTAYIPGRTLPMLPKKLTRNISLTTDDDSFAHTVFLTVDATSGAIKSYRRCHTKIKIKKRLNFKEVEDYIQNQSTCDDWTEELKNNINLLISNYHKMRENRKELENFLSISTTEIRIIRDDDTKKITGLKKKKQGEADQLIEEYMLAANSAVARELTNKKIPGIYRTHPAPDEEKIEEFTNFVHDVFKISTGNLNSGRVACQHFLDKIKDKNFEEIIISAFLRSLKRALYQASPDIHFGLGKGLYSHFTSPIRRYTDLIVHQQLWNYDLSKQVMGKEIIGEIAKDCSDKEKNNDEAYYAANDRLKLHYLQQFLSSNTTETFEGIVRKLTSSSILADLPDIGITAVIPVRSMRGSHRKSKGKLVSKKGSSNYKPGDFVYLKLKQIDFIKGNAIFKIIQF